MGRYTEKQGGDGGRRLESESPWWGGETSVGRGGCAWEEARYRGVGVGPVFHFLARVGVPWMLTQSSVRLCIYALYVLYFTIKYKCKIVNILIRS